MAKETKARYSDEELENFRKLIEEKINKAQADLELLRSAYMNDGNNGTDDTSPLLKPLRKVQKPCPRKPIRNWPSVRKSSSVI